METHAEPVGRRTTRKMCVTANTATTIDGTKKTVENSVVKRRKKSRNINGFGNSDYENTNSSDSVEQFDCVQISVLSRTMRIEAFTNLRIRLPQKKGKHKLKLRIDSGAAGNTLPVRTIRQMYGHKYKDVIQRAHNVRLTAYNGQDIPCLGSISISIKKQKATCLPNSTWWTYQDQQ